MNSNLWVLSVPLAVFSRFTNTQPVVWDKAGKAVRHEMKSTAETMLSPLESFQQTGQMSAGSHSVRKAGIDQHACECCAGLHFHNLLFCPICILLILLYTTLSMIILLRE